MSTMKNLILISLLILIIHLLPAQTNEKTHRPFQLSFISPLSTNGIESPKIDNTVSINLLAGVNGGVKAFEIGGIMNWNQGSVQGLQMAGITNIVRGSMTGLQVGGIYNFSQESQSGVQIGGIANSTMKQSVGLTLAGIANYQSGAKGVSMAGITNVNFGKSSGLQVAGIANVNLGSVTGLQLAGIYNYVSTLNGAQIGFVNYSDSVSKGIPIGFISIVRKNGYRKLEFESNETFYGNLTFKTGVRRFYNIFSIGGRPGKTGYWGPGYGIGSAWDVNPKVGMNIDLIAYHVNEGESWTNELNLMNRLKLNLSYRISPRLELIGGPVYVVSVSQITDAEGNVIGGGYLPTWTLSDKVHGSTRVSSYLGFNIGLRL